MPAARLRALTDRWRFGAAGRQYLAFSGIAHGRHTHRFFRKLIAGGFATTDLAAPAHAGRLYHLQYKPWYRLLGEPDHRHRRPMSVGRAVERLMVLDGVLAEPELTWLGLARDKVATFTNAPWCLPTPGETTRSCGRPPKRAAASSSRRPVGGRLADPQTLNRYAYARNNPLRYVDPTGMYEVDAGQAGARQFCDDRLCPRPPRQAACTMFSTRRGTACSGSRTIGTDGR